MALTIVDLMEYANDAAAQAAYGTANFRYYRLNITAVNSTNAYIGQLQLLSGATVISPSNMTADNLPSPYVVSASSSWEGDTNWRKYFAFDSYIGSSPADHMGWNQQGATGWLKIDLGSTQSITSYKIYSTSHNVCPRDWTLEGSATGAFAGEQTTLDTRTGVGNWGADTAVSYSLSDPTGITIASEATFKSEGSYALKATAAITTSLNKTFARFISPSIDLSAQTILKFDLRASRTGSNIKLGIRDQGGSMTEVTPVVNAVDAYQTCIMDLSSVAAADKDAITEIIITILNADAANIIYIDNVVADTMISYLIHRGRDRMRTTGVSLG